MFRMAANWKSEKKKNCLRLTLSPLFVSEPSSFSFGWPKKHWGRNSCARGQGDAVFQSIVRVECPPKAVAHDSADKLAEKVWNLVPKKCQSTRTQSAKCWSNFNQFFSMFELNRNWKVRKEMGATASSLWWARKLDIKTAKKNGKLRDFLSPFHDTYW